MTREQHEIRGLFRSLLKESRYPFPAGSNKLQAPAKHGVYIIRRGEYVIHVGRTQRGRRGLYQRLNNHLRGASSFVRKHLHGKGARLRSRYTFQLLPVGDPRRRALLEAYTVGMLCPKHLGLGK